MVLNLEPMVLLSPTQVTMYVVLLLASVSTSVGTTATTCVGTTSTTGVGRVEARVNNRIPCSSRPVASKSIQKHPKGGD